LHGSLDPAVTDTIKEIQNVPTGLAIGPKDTQSGQILLGKKEDIQQVIQGSNAELEQKWAIFVIPSAIKQDNYRNLQTNSDTSTVEKDAVGARSPTPAP